MNPKYNLLIFIITCILLTSCSTTKHGVPFIADNGIQWGIQDTITGKVYLKPKFHYLRKTAYKNRFIAVDASGQYSLVNHKGKPVWSSTPRRIQLTNTHYASIEYKTGKKGLLELKRCRVIIPPKYSSIVFFDANNIGVGLDGKFGVVNLKHQEIVPIIYTSIEGIGEHYLVGIQDKYGVVNQKGETVIPVKYDRIFFNKAFNGYLLVLDGLRAPANLDGKIGQWFNGSLSGFNPYGFMFTKVDSNGKYAYNRIYNRAFKPLTDLERGYMAYRPELKGYIRSSFDLDTSYFTSAIDNTIQIKGELLLLGQLEQCYKNTCISKSKEGIFKVKANGEVEKLPYSDFQVGFNKDRLIVKKEDFWGCVTWDNKVIIPFHYAFIQYHNRHELYSARTDTTVHFYELSGESSAQFSIDRAKGDRVELLRDAYFKIRKGGKWALFSPRGDAITNFVFDELKSSYSICTGRINNQWQFVTLKGEILPDRFDVIHPFHERREEKYIYTYRVQQGHLYGLYNSNGERIIPVDYKRLFVPSEGLIAVLKGDKWGFVNKRNDVVIPFLYDKGRAFHGGRARVEINREKLWINKLGETITVE